METLLERILLAIVEDVGPAILAKVLASTTTEEQARALLDGELRAIRAASDAIVDGEIAREKKP